MVEEGGRLSWGLYRRTEKNYTTRGQLIHLGQEGTNGEGGSKGESASVCTASRRLVQSHTWCIMIHGHAVWLAVAGCASSL